MEFTPAFFDEASAAWKMNKKRVGQMYVYVCSADRDRNAVEFCSTHIQENELSTAMLGTAKLEKKLTHGYNLRSRSHHAPVQRVYNTRASVHARGS